MKRLIQIVLTIIPLLAPIPAAWVIFNATLTSLHWPLPVAGVAAITIEGLGFASVNLAQRLYTFNRGLRVDERAQKWIAPTWQPLTAALLYLLVTMTAILLLDISAILARILPAIFPLLGITGAALWSIYIEQEARQASVDAYRAERRSKLAQRRSGNASDGPSDAQRRSAKANVARKSLSDARQGSQRRSATLYRCECGRTFSDRFKYSGHSGRCAAHLQAKAGPAIPVEMPKTNMTKENKP